MSQGHSKKGRVQPHTLRVIQRSRGSLTLTWLAPIGLQWLETPGPSAKLGSRGCADTGRSISVVLLQVQEVFGRSTYRVLHMVAQSGRLKCDTS